MATLTKKTVKTPRKSAAAKSAAAKPETRTEEPKKKQAASASVTTSSSTPKTAKAQPAGTVPQPKEKDSDKEKPVKEKIKKPKLVRDSFTMPENEYQVLGDLKKACVKVGFEIKKSELLRIGVALLKKMPASQIQQALSGLAPLKAGRPKKEK